MQRLYVILILCLFACESPVEEVEEIQEEENIEAEVILSESFGVDYVFSDSAILRAKLFAAHVIEKQEKIEELEEKVHYLYDTVRISFLDAYGREASWVNSQEGIFRIDKKLAEVKGGVVLTNRNGEVLTTDHLFWNQDIDSIYTDDPVRIQTPDKIIRSSNGMRSNTAFTSYVLFGIQGEMETDEQGF